MSWVLVGKKFSVSSSVEYRPSKTVVFCGKKCPPVVIVLLVNLKYDLRCSDKKDDDLLTHAIIERISKQIYIAYVFQKHLKKYLRKLKYSRY